MLATTLRRFEEAERLFQQAIDMNRGMPAPGFLTHALFQRARMLSLRDEAGDGGRARADLDEAVEVSTRVGQAALLDRARALREDLG